MEAEVQGLQIESMARKSNCQCQCGEELYRRPSELAKNPEPMCLRCRQVLGAKKLAESLYKKYIDRWLAGDKDGMRGKTAISNHIRRWLTEKHQGQCSRCGWAEVNPHTGRVPLEVEHLDGSFTNNRPENLDLVCPNCHSLTNTYRSLNRGRGRPR